MNIFTRVQDDHTTSDVIASSSAEDKNDEIHKVLDILNAFSQKNYFIPIEIEGPLGEALKSNSRMRRKDVTDDLSRTVNFSVQASEAIAATALIVEDIRHVGNDAQTMASSIEEMSASISQVANASEQTASAAKDAQQAAMDSAQEIDHTRAAMQKISELGALLSERLEVLEEAVGQIEGMAGTIEGISDQTKLLALNATIEAARAGQAGKGFAVVASEVKSLSEQASQATDNIKRRIGSLNSEMSEMKGAMSSSLDAVSEGEVVVENIATKVDNINERVSGASVQMDEIASILTQQREAVGEIAHNVNSIADNAGKSRDNIDQIVTSVVNIENVIDERLQEIDAGVVPCFILYQAISDHMRWKKHLAEMFAGLKDLDVSGLSDCHTCRFGKWYDNTTEPALLNSVTFRAIKDPHEKVHKHGKAAAKYFTDGHHDEAKAEFALMDEASKEVVRLLEVLIEERIENSEFDFG
jgi:methyl-accepting chemotaxis protein